MDEQEAQPAVDPANHTQEANQTDETAAGEGHRDEPSAEDVNTEAGGEPATEDNGTDAPVAESGQNEAS